MINAQKAKILAIIPARYASTRFPGKPLTMIQGRSMISRVYDQVQQSKLVDAVVVATDDQRIFEHLTSIGAEVVMTRADHPSGTDRCAEVLNNYPEAEIILNVQGDEPFIQPEQIDLLTKTLLNQPDNKIATLAKKITDATALHNSNIVKVAIAINGKALYFSRHPIPFVRGKETAAWFGQVDFYKHIGLYAFRRACLLEIAKLAPSPLEIAESLEQLRWLENGFSIAVGITELETIGIDVPEDIERALWTEQGSHGAVR